MARVATAGSSSLSHQRHACSNMAILTTIRALIDTWKKAHRIQRSIYHSRRTEERTAKAEDTPTELFRLRTKASTNSTYFTPRKKATLMYCMVLGHRNNRKKMKTSTQHQSRTKTNHAEKKRQQQKTSESNTNSKQKKKCTNPSLILIIQTQKNSQVLPFSTQGVRIPTCWSSNGHSRNHYTTRRTSSSSL